MGVTRRVWGEVVLAGVLVASAVLLARPVLLVGAAGVGGWVLSQQYAFVRSVSAVAEEISVTQSLARERVATGDEVTVVLAVELPDASPVQVEVEAQPPVGVRADEADLAATLRAGERGATTEFTIRCPLAGTFRFERPTVTATDRAGRFGAAFEADSTPAVTVNPRRPTDVHVGAGGNQLTASYGDYPSDERGTGVELADIRSYVAGDTLRHIDWNATARFGHPFVREFHTETDRRTALFLDCRPSMRTGPDGGTKFDYAREVALGLLENARRGGSPLDVFPVGEDGVLADESLFAAEVGYETVDRHLRALEPQVGPTADETGSGTESPAAARRRARRLRGDESAFAAALEPFFADADPYVERVEGDPLYAAVRRRLDSVPGTDLSVVLTDDANRAETREVARVARRNGNHVSILLTPAVLFDESDTFDVEDAYERYADFERFRRALSEMDRVSAFEVGPGDRLEALLAAKTPRGERARAGD